MTSILEDLNLATRINSEFNIEELIDLNKKIEKENKYKPLLLSDIELSTKTSEIIYLFAEIAKPFKDKIGGEKLDSIQSWLNKRNISNKYIPGIGKIVNQVESPRIILVSHIDLIRKFQKGFEEGNTHSFLTTKNDKHIIQGGLDNTITNSVALLAIEHLLKNNYSDVELVLTEGEEVGMIGMSNYIKEFTDKSNNAFFINLDVTNEGWKQNASVEYDKPSFTMLKQLQNILSDHDAYFTHERVCDDTDAINRHGCAGFSFCIPTKDIIHSYENKAYIHTLEGYFDGLISLLTKIELIDFKTKFHNSYFKKALKVDSFDYIKIKMIEEKEFSYKEKSTISTYRDTNEFNYIERTNSFDYPNKSYVKKERARFFEGCIAWIDFRSHSLAQEKLITDFIEYHIMENKKFTEEEFIVCFPESKNPRKNMHGIIDMYVENGALINLNNEYVFEKAEDIDF